MQGASYERNSKNGSLHRIPRKITISRAKPTTKARQAGFSKAGFSKSESRLLSCGSMANVRPFYSPFLRTPLTPAFVAGSEKSVLWLVVFLCCCRISRLKLPCSSAIIEDIMGLREAGSAKLAYYYCDFRDEDKQNCRNLLLSIVSQLCAQSDLCCDILSPIYSSHDNGARKSSDGILTKCLTEMLSLPAQGPIYLIVDALDECPNHSGMPTPREEVLNLVNDLVDLHLPNLHICVTSCRRSTYKPLSTL